MIESVNIHDDIKIGLPSRDLYIENYKETIRNLAAYGIEVICYNFMPIFDWIKTDLDYRLADGSSTMAFEKAGIDKDPEEIVKEVEESSSGYTLPGWEPERLAHVKELFLAYKDVDDDKLRENFAYFLKAIIPTCEEVGIKMAVHPDDPPIRFLVCRVSLKTAMIWIGSATWSTVRQMASHFVLAVSPKTQTIMSMRFWLSFVAGTGFLLPMFVTFNTWVMTKTFMKHRISPLKVR